MIRLSWAGAISDIMKVLIGCEVSGICREAFAARGHDAWSCDVLDTEQPGNHITGEVLDVLGGGWDLAIFHPPCTFLCTTGNRWMAEKYRERFPTRVQDREDAIKFFMTLVNAPIPKIAIENPVGIMSSHYRKPDQYVQPHWFGHPHSKKTGLWLKNLPKLQPTNRVEEGERTRFPSGRSMPRWYKEIGDLPIPQRAALRSRTFKGFAEAMAQQWNFNTVGNLYMGWD